MMNIESEIGCEPPVFIIDNVGDLLHPHDHHFMKTISQLAQSNRVNVFVLTHNRQTANDLCRKHGRIRIVPLPGFYKGTPTGQEDVEWVEDPWLISTNSKLVLKVYDIIATSTNHTQQQADGSVVVNFLEDGDLPAIALRKAKEVACSIQMPSSETQLDDDLPDFL